MIIQVQLLRHQYFPSNFAFISLLDTPPVPCYTIIKSNIEGVHAVLDRSVIGQVQTSSDFFHGHARLCVLQFAVQVSSPLFSVRLQELSFLRECHREEYPAGIRYSFSSATLPQKADATLHPSVVVRIAFPTSSEDGSNQTAPCSNDFLPADISAPG